VVVALALGVALASAPARSQHGIVPPEDRPLHERLAAARIVAIATVAEVDVGRIAFEAVEPVLGRAPAELRMKRSPSKPPPWRAGDRVLLLLAGARSPYVWVDRPVEAVTLADADAERRVARAVRALDAVRVDAKARRDLYARWSDADAEPLASLGLRGLLDVGGMAGAMDAEFARARAGAAFDPELPVEARRRAARVAARHPRGVARLLEELAADSDPEIAEVALRFGLIVRDPRVEPRIVDLLDAPESELGRIGLELAALARGIEVERRLSELAVGHPAEDVRDEAVDALERLRRNRTPRG